MFSKLFKTINPVVVIFLAVFTVLLGLNSIINPPTEIVTYPEPFANFLFSVSFISQLSPILKVLLSIVLVFITALMFNRIIVINNFYQRSGYFTAFFYIVLCATNPHMFSLHPVVFVNLLMVMIIGRVFRLYKKQRVLRLLYDTGFLMGVTMLLYAPALVLLPWLLLSINTLRPFQWREWALGVFGVLTPWVLSLSIWFLYDEHEAFSHYWTSIGSQSMNWKAIFLVWKNISLVFILIAILISAFYMLNHFLKNIIAIRKYLQLLMLFLVMALLTLFMKMHYIHEHFLLINLPVAILLANYYQLNKSKWFSEALLITLTLSAIIGQFL